MADFEFVANNGHPSRATAAARSHAVKSGLQRKATVQQHGSRDSQLTVRHKATLNSRFRLQANTGTAASASTRDGSQRQKANNVARSRGDQVHQDVPDRTQAVVIVAPSQARGDPFNAHLISQNEGVDRLIKFFVSRFRLQISISQIQKQWWGYAVGDPVVLHATLSLAATFWAMLVPEPDEVNQAGLKQKALALRGVQKRLDENDTSDGVLGAIATLACVEAADSNYQAASVHMHGIQMLCNARGGYTSFKNSIHVARAMNWADLQVAVGLGSRPLLPLFHPLEAISIPAKVLSLSAEPSLAHLNIFESTENDGSVRYTLSVLRQAYYGLNYKTLSVHDLRVLINGADYQIAHVLAGTSLAARGHAIILAAQVFMHQVVREVPMESSLPVLLNQRLRDHLQAVQDQLMASPDYWHGFVWCLSIGAATTPRPGSNWDFYYPLLATMAQKMNVKRASEHEKIMQRFIWDDSLSPRLRPGNQWAQTSVGE